MSWTAPPSGPTYQADISPSVEKVMIARPTNVQPGRPLSAREHRPGSGCATTRSPRRAIYRCGGAHKVCGSRYCRRLGSNPRTMIRLVRRTLSPHSDYQNLASRTCHSPSLLRQARLTWDGTTIVSACGGVCASSKNQTERFGSEGVDRGHGALRR